MFTFLIALTKTNASLSHWYFTRQQQDDCSQQLDVRQDLALQMLGNNLEGEQNGMTTRGTCKKVERDHELVKAPERTGRWLGDKWHKVKSKYLARKCSVCKKDTRTYCKCTVGMFLCADCFVDHVIECGRT